MLPRLFAPLALALLAVPQVFAATSTFYVVARETSQSGVTITTEVSVTNPTDKALSFTVLAMPSGISNDGTSRDGMVESSIEIPPRQTLVVKGLTDHNEALLEIRAPEELAFLAHLVPAVDGTRGHPVQVPFISSETLIGAGETAFIQNVEGITNLGVVNGSSTPTNCSYGLYFADGRLQGKYSFTHQPLSHAAFHDVLGLIFERGTKDLSIEISCDQDFFPFGDVVYSDTGQLGTLNPSQTGFSALTPPGLIPVCPSNATCFDLKQPYIPRSGSEALALQIPIPPGFYDKVELQMEVVHGGWNGSGGGFYNMFYLAVNQDWGRTIAFTQVRQPNELLHDHGGDQKSSFKRGVAAWVPGERYRFEYTWDAGERDMELVVLDSGGEIVRLNGAPQVGGYNVGNNGFIFLELSLPKHSAFHGDRSSLGWLYEKLHVAFSRR